MKSLALNIGKNLKIPHLTNHSATPIITLLTINKPNKKTASFTPIRKFGHNLENSSIKTFLKLEKYNKASSIEHCKRFYLISVAIKSDRGANQVSLNLGTGQEHKNNLYFGFRNVLFIKIELY